MRRFVIALVVSATLVSAQDIKNWNQCYYDKRAAAPRELMPCLSPSDVEKSNSKAKSSWCCFAGHACVDQACWDPDTSVTYQYGCNDPDYADSNCPSKCGLDRGKSPWVGLVRCEDNNNEGRLKDWVCNHPDTCGETCPAEPNRPQRTMSIWPSNIVKLPQREWCQGLTTTITALNAPTRIPNAGSVPARANTSGKLDFTRVPTSTVQVIPSTAPGTATVSASTTEPTNTSVETPQPTPGGAALGGGAIAGIAVGSTVAVGSVIAAIFFMWRRRQQRRHRHQVSPITPTAPQYTPMSGTNGIAELPHDEKGNLMGPHSPSSASDPAAYGAGIQRPVSDMSGQVSPSPMSTPRINGSPFYQQGSFSTHAELASDGRVIHEMPAINERAEMP